MIKKLESNTRYSTARRGFQHVGEVIERLIGLYEIQAEMNREREAEQVADGEVLGFESEVEDQVFTFTTQRDVPAIQSTFGWE